MRADFTANVRSIRRSSFGIVEPVLALGILVFFVALYGRLMSYGIRRDEMMFVPPAVLLDTQQLYVDFFYNHLPYSAWYFRGFEFIFGAGGLLFSARVGVYFAWIALAAITAGVVWSLSRSALVTLFGIIGLLTSQTLMEAPGMAATNNFLQLPFVVLALGLFLIEATGDKPRFGWLVLAGAFASIAVGVKLSAIAILPAGAIAALVMPASLTFAARLRRVLFPLLIGGVIGAVPLIWYAVADWDLFLAHVLRFHLGPHIAYWEAHQASEPGLAFGLMGKLRLAYAAWLEGTPLLMTLVILSMALSLLGGGGRYDRVGAGIRQGIGFAVASLVVAVVMSLVPTPGFPQYYILPLAILPLLTALAYRALDESWRAAMRPVLAAAIGLMLVLAVPWLAAGLNGVLRPETTTPAATLRGGAALKHAIDEAQPAGDKVATFMPIYPLEAGLPVYPELATGQFAYRIAPFTSAELAAHYKMVGADGIETLFDADPPAAMVLGYAPDLEVALLRYAETNGYRLVEVGDLANRYGAGKVYVNRPEGSE